MSVILKSKKCMTKDEVSLLVDLIQSKPILTSKETNASTNKHKEDTWNSLTCTFNARSGSIPRTTEQLKLKWDNLKKAARKRAQNIRMNNLKTGGGKQDFIPPDEILEKVSGMLGSTCTGFTVPFGDDGVGTNQVLEGSRLNTEDCLVTENIDEQIFSDNGADEGIINTPNKDTQRNKRKIDISQTPPSAARDTESIKFFDIPRQQKNMKRCRRNEEQNARVARNLAIANYYKTKTEKLDLELKILKLELANKEKIL